VPCWLSGGGKDMKLSYPDLEKLAKQQNEHVAELGSQNEKLIVQLKACGKQRAWAEKKLEAEMANIKLAIGKALDSATLSEAENILNSLL
jgi:hypothetical protein